MSQNGLEGWAVLSTWPSGGVKTVDSKTGSQAAAQKQRAFLPSGSDSELSFTA